MAKPTPYKKGMLKPPSTHTSGTLANTTAIIASPAA
jgi:hypothetical protein